MHAIRLHSYLYVPLFAFLFHPIWLHSLSATAEACCVNPTMSAYATTAHLPTSTLLTLAMSLQPRPRSPHLLNFLPATALLVATSLLLFSLGSLSSKRAPMQRHPLPPGPAAWPVVGSLLMMLRHKTHFRWVLSVTDGRDITCIRLGRVHVVVVNSPELAREFLRTHDANFASRPLTMATEYSGRGFLSVVISPWGEQWKKMRRVLTSEALSPTRFRCQGALRAEEIDHFTRYLRNLCADDGHVDVRRATRYYCGNMIRRMVFGASHFGEGGAHGGPGEEELEHVDAVFKVLSCIYAFCPSDFMPSLRWLDLGGHERVMKEATSTIYKYHDPIIDARLEKWRSWRTGKEEKKEVEDLLDVFLSLRDTSGKPLLNSEEIRAQCAELVYATVDNPSTIVEWALAHMLDQPAIAERAVEELDRVVGPDRLVEEADFAQLPYLKACIREAHRIHQVAPFNLPHVAIDDAVVAGYFIPKGSMVLLGRVGLGRNPKVWIEPLRFEPERHLKDGPGGADLAEPDLRFISFSTGRRQCMGAPLGTVMTYMMFGRMLQAFHWSLPAGEVGVDFSEEEKSLLKGKPLIACPKPRLLALLSQL